MLPIASEIAVRLTREQAQSALPGAPVLPDEPAPTPRERRRFKTAVLLRRLADRVEPAPRFRGPVRAD
ncbi:MAG: hypothetical protein ACRDO2_04995 [Nocardioidaceae bacterium]